MREVSKPDFCQNAMLIDAVVGCMGHGTNLFLQRTTKLSQLVSLENHHPEHNNLCRSSRESFLRIVSGRLYQQMSGHQSPGYLTSCFGNQANSSIQVRVRAPDPSFFQEAPLALDESVTALHDAGREMLCWPSSIPGFGGRAGSRTLGPARPSMALLGTGLAKLEPLHLAGIFSSQNKMSPKRQQNRPLGDGECPKKSTAHGTSAASDGVEIPAGSG